MVYKKLLFFYKLMYFHVNKNIEGVFLNYSVYVLLYIIYLKKIVTNMHVTT